MNWNRKFLEIGGGELVDIFTTHDYEGNESLDPAHWRWKFGELRKLLDEFGMQGKPVWQTERGWLGVRQDSFSPLSQAIRTMLHRDMLETFGIPSENSHFYYLNNGGYGGYPAFLWSQNGPHIGPLATRVREAQVKGKKYAGELDFGPTGNKILMGIHFSGEDEDLYIVRNLGFADQTVSFGWKGSDTATVMDWAGNVLKDKPSHGELSLAVTQMPTYIRVAKGDTLTPPVMDFGKNIAGEAKFTFNGKSNADGVRSAGGRNSNANNTASLNNGIVEMFHHGSPHHEGKMPFFREIVEDFPQMLEITFPEPKEVSKMLVLSVRADNPYSALLDFDVQYLDDSNQWITVKELRTPIPVSEFADAPYSKVYSWIDDTNAFVVRFDKPVKASQFRLVILKTTAGLIANDPVARDGKDMPTVVDLREIEIYTTAL